MRNLVRNQSTVIYKAYTGKTPVYADGVRTGDFEPQYGDLKSTKMYVGSPTGVSAIDVFGSFAQYDRIMSTFDMSTDITEDSVLWLDGADTTKGHNYIVKRVAPWKNSIVYAVSKVETTDE